jgi:O-antigen/teichoic acid export membrane protein
MNDTPRRKSSLTNQSAWILFAKVVGFGLNMLFPLLIVRYLTQDNVGVYRQVFLVASNAVLVLPLGFSMSAYYFLNREPEKHPSTVFNILIFNFAMGGLAFFTLFFFPQILGSAFQSQEMTRLAPLIGVLIWLWIFSSFLETVALAMQEARLTAFFIVIAQLIKTALMTTAVLFYANVDSLIYASIVLFVLQAIVLLVYLHGRFPYFWKNFDLSFFRRQMAYALPFGLSVLLYVGQTDIHNYFVSHGFSAVEFAIYSQGCFQLPLIAMLYESVGSVMIPRMSQLQHEGKKREMLLMTVRATQKLTFFYFPLFCYLMIVGYEFVTTLFTKEYAASVPIFHVNLLALPLFSLVVDPIVRAYPEAGRWLLKLRIGIIVTLLVIFWIGIGRFDMITMISIVVAAILFEKIAAAWISARMLEVRAADIGLLKTIGKIAIAAILSGLILLAFYLLSRDILMQACLNFSQRLLSFADIKKGVDLIGGSMFLGICFAIYGTVYLLIANWLGAIEQDDKDKVLGVWRKMTRRNSVVNANGHVSGDL